MKREEVLQKLGFTVPDAKKKRLIIHSDIKNEADDHFAIMQHLLSPSIQVEGIIAGHFEWIARTLFTTEEAKKEQLFAPRKESMERSFQEGTKLLDLAKIDDVPLLRGSVVELSDLEYLPDSEGADFIIKEALKEDERPLYIALMGCTTDLAIAYLKEPKIADKIIAIWIGGGDYPDGEDEFNLKQDILGANVLFQSPIAIYQIPKGTYKQIEVSFAELMYQVKPCGPLGEYLCQQMFTLNNQLGNHPELGKMDWPHGETWCIGDNPTLGVLLSSSQRVQYHIEKAPTILEDCSYEPNPQGKEIRVYDSFDVRLTVGDLFAKLALCYR